MKRPPIVAVLGHVDHGKTTLLDTIRKTNVVEREVGQITQSIGAYEVSISPEEEEKKITFIDTPGHEAFLAMRSRGVSAADIALLVVAANEGVKPQTQESIKSIKESEIPLIVVFTKSDLPNIDISQVKQQLIKEKVLLEGLGGNVPSLSVSAKTGQGIKELLDLISLVWEMEEQPSLEKMAQDKLTAVVIESRLDSRRGIAITLVIKSGILHLADEVFGQSSQAKIRAILNSQGKNLKEALPGSAVEVLGFTSLPSPGEVVQDKEIESEEIKSLFKEKKEPGILFIIVKADNLGSLEAILSLLPEEVTVVSGASGEVNESDIFLAKAQKAIVIAFNSVVRKDVLKLAEIERVIIKQYRLIYELLDEVKEVVEGLKSGRKLDKEVILGKATILASFPYEKTKVLGIRVVEGRVALGDKVKLLRKEEEIGESRVKSLKKKKEDVKVVQKGEEGGVIVEPSLDFELSDMLLSYRI